MSAAATTDTPDRCLSVRQLAHRWRVAPKKVRALIRRGLLQGFTLPIGRREVRISPEAVLEFERRAAVLPAAPRRRRVEEIDPEVAAMLAET